MRGIVITAATTFALAGCSEAPTKDYYRQLSENVTMVMCGSEPEDRARALSEIVELTNGDGDSPEQAVFDEASSYADDGCPKGAGAMPDSST